VSPSHSNSSAGPIELDEPSGQPIRPLIPVILEQPLPVRLVAIEDVHVPCPAGVDHLLDAFYVDLLNMVRLNDIDDIDENGVTVIRFRADNHVLHLHVEDRPVEHDALRPLIVELDDRASLMKKLIANHIHYEWVKGIAAGDDHVLLIDPAGNYVGVIHHVRV
jgi:hypothetical protein